MVKNLDNVTMYKVDGQVGEITRCEYRARCFYSSNCNPKDIESSIVRPLGASIYTFRSLVNNNRSYASVVSNLNFDNNVTSIQRVNTVQQACRKFTDTNKGNSVVNEKDGKNEDTECNSVDKQTSVPNAASAERLSYLDKGCSDTVSTRDEEVFLYDVNSSADDKFVYSLLFNGNKKIVNACNNVSLQQFRAQSKYMFGFIPMSEPLMPSNSQSNLNDGYSVVDLHKKVKKFTENKIFWVLASQCRPS